MYCLASFATVREPEGDTTILLKFKGSTAADDNVKHTLLSAEDRDLVLGNDRVIICYNYSPDYHR